MLLIPAALVGFGVYKAAQSYDQKMANLDEATEFARRHNPTSNRFEPFEATNFDGAIPTAVIPDVDVRGVPMYQVMYGTGARTLSYGIPQWRVGGPKF